jgi:REP element-mobilizing transposase RayT
VNVKSKGIYHIYNRGNNQQPIFFSDDNYIYFLNKCHRYLKPLADILAWCLMPNHFHFLTEVTETSLEPVKSGGIIMPAITNGFRLLESSYAKGVNKQLSRSGNLFQQKTKAKFTNEAKDYSRTAFHYIHQNPVKSGLVKRLEEWHYSSYLDYAGLRNGTLCNREKAGELFSLNEIDLYTETMKTIEDDLLKNIL